MIRKSFLIGLVFCVAVSCKLEADKVDLPEKLIDTETMVEMLYEIQLIEASYRGRSVTDTLARDTMKDRMRGLMAKYSVSDSDFKASYNYYNYDPKIMEELFNEVLTKLNTRMTEEEGVAE